jgi:hypothetical protein
MKVRIIKKEDVTRGNTYYVIQKRHWLARWIWIDAGRDSMYTDDYYDTLEDAEANIQHYLPPKFNIEVIKENIEVIKEYA